jgi:aspartate aminotransferase-like enzyme
MCDEPEGFQTFRLGLFGLDKIQNVERTVTTFAEALDQVL